MDRYCSVVPHSKPKVFFAATLSLTVSALTGWAGLHRGQGVPPRDTLQRAVGHVTGVERGEHQLRLDLDSSSSRYAVLSKSGSLTRVERELLRDGSEITEVLYEPELVKPLWGSEFYTAYAVTVGGREVRSLEHVTRAYSSDDTVGLWVSPIFLLLSVSLFIYGIRLR
jgi:hypothetical protein